ncbi:transcriptional regulator [Saprospiraceae bacterium]|nr:transcriptional regulator [Saprospiraceae bacterium]
MKLEKARLEFIQSWGIFGSDWGIPKSMGQIHALLLSHKDSVTTEEVMEQIHLSRGNVHANLQELIAWGLISKQTKLGERKDFFQAEHDVWTIAKNIVEQRKKKELEPVKEMLKSLKEAKLEGDKQEVKHFQTLIKDLEDFVSQMDQLTSLMTKMNDNIFFKKMFKVISKKK